MQRQMLINQQMQQATMAYQQQLSAMPPAAPGMPPPPMPPAPSIEVITDQIGPPQVIVLEEWINEARREIEASSMRVVDHDAQVDNLSLYLQTMGPLVAATPAGQKLNASIINEFMRLTRFSAEAQKAAEEYVGQISMMAGITPAGPLPMGGPNPKGNPAKPTPEPDQGRAQAAAGLAQ